MSTLRLKWLVYTVQLLTYNQKTQKGVQRRSRGWLKDKYGVSWQVIPRRLNELMGDKDKKKAGRATQAMLKMKKIVIKDLEKAYEGK